MYKPRVAVALIAFSLVASAVGSVRSVPAAIQASSDARLNEQLEQFERFLAEMQRELAIPGMSAAIVKDHRVIWAQGFGCADVEAKRAALPDNLTKSPRSPSPSVRPSCCDLSNRAV